MERIEGAAVTVEGIEIRHCRSLREYEECLRLEQITWGTGILVPTAIFVVAQETGGQILGAFAGSEMIGFTLALAGIHQGRPFLHSHMTAVLEAYRDRGVGRALKLFQRQDALSRDIHLVEWTFDPLEIKNARFNLMRLGAIVRRLIPNCYGITDSPLHMGMPTDRLVAEWWLDSPRVNRLVGEAQASQSARPPVEHARISFPSNIAELRAQDRAAAEQIQANIRQQFEARFANDEVVTAIESTPTTADYILEPRCSISAQIFPQAKKRRG
jgi:predicted GNAT superfamily acetyltransferase